MPSTPAQNGRADTSLPGFPTPHPPLADALHSHVSAEELALKLDEESVLSGGMATFAAVSSLGLYTPCEDEEHNGEAR